MTSTYRPIITTPAFGDQLATMERVNNGSYVRLVDYEKLKAERDALDRMVNDMTAHIRVDKA